MSVKFPYLSARYVAIAIPSTESRSCTDGDDVEHPSSIWNSSAPTRTLRAWSVPPAALVLVPCLGSIPASSASAGSGSAGQGLRNLCDRAPWNCKGRSRKSEANNTYSSRLKALIGIIKYIPTIAAVCTLNCGAFRGSQSPNYSKHSQSS